MKLLPLFLLKSQQPVPVILVLLPPSRQLRRKTNTEIVHQGVEPVQDRDDTTLFFEGWNQDKKALDLAGV